MSQVCPSLKRLEGACPAVGIEGDHLFISAEVQEAPTSDCAEGAVNAPRGDSTPETLSSIDHRMRRV